MSSPSLPGRRRRSLAVAAVAAACSSIIGASIQAPAAHAAPAAGAQVPAASAGAGAVVTLLQRGISRPAGMVVEVPGVGTAIVDSGHNRVVATSFPTSATLFSVLPFTGLRAPKGIAANRSTLYVADTGHNRVVELNGNTQTTLPFTGLSAPAGVAVDGAGDVFVADTGHNRILGLAAGASSPVVEPFGTLASPQALVADASGNLFAADTGDNRVLELAAGASAATVLPILGMTGPRALALGEGNRLLVATSSSVLVYSIDWGVARPLSVFTGLSSPQGIAAYPSFSGDPFVAVADTGHNRVVEFGGQQSAPTTLVPPVPRGFGRQIIASNAAGDVLYPTGNQVWEIKAGTTTPISLPFTAHGVRQGVAVDRAGDVFVLIAGTVTELPVGGTTPFAVGPSISFGCGGLGVDDAGDLFLGCDGIPFGPGTISGAIELARGSSAWTNLFAVPTAGIAGLAVDGAGDVWVTDAGDNALYGQLAGTSTVLRIAVPVPSPQPVFGVGGAAFDPYGTLYFAANFTVYGVVPGTTVVYQTSLGFTTSTLPLAVAADGHGNLYLNDESPLGGTFDIKELVHLQPPSILPVNAPLTAEQLASDRAGDIYYTGQLQGAFALSVKAAAPVAVPDPGPELPYGVAVDSAGDVFLADRGGIQIREITPANQQVTIAGPGIGGANSLGVDASGNLYIVGGLQVFRLAKGDTTWTAVLTSPTVIADMAVDRAGDIVIAELGGQVAEQTAGSTTLTALPFGAVSSPTAVAIDSHGDIFAADTPIPGSALASSGAHIYELATGATAPLPLLGDGFPHVYGLAVDASGHVFAATTGGMLEAQAN